MPIKTPFAEDVPQGTELPTLVKEPITRVQIAKYAGASGDFNPLHVDEEYATTRAGFKSVIAHGMLSMGILGQFLTDWLGDPRLLKKISVQFRGNVFPGDTLTCKGIVSNRYSAEGRELADCDIHVENQSGQQVTVGVATVMLPSREVRESHSM
jgi:acyl dehydratase